MDFQDVAKAITDGELDGDLDKIWAVIKSRRQSLASLSFYTFNVGDKVRFNSTTKPAYLVGRTGTLVGMRRKKVTVDLDTPAGRFYKGIVTPVSLIEKVE